MGALLLAGFIACDDANGDAATRADGGDRAPISEPDQEAGQGEADPGAAGKDAGEGGGSSGSGGSGGRGTPGETASSQSMPDGGQLPGEGGTMSESDGNAGARSEGGSDAGARSDGDVAGAGAFGSSDEDRLSPEERAALEASRGWTLQFAGGAQDLAKRVAVDWRGDVVVAGETRGNLTGDAEATGGDVFVTKRSSQDGAALWTVQFAPGREDTCGGLALDGDGDAFVAMTTNQGGVSADEMVVTRLASADGSVVWTVGASAVEELAVGLAVDAVGDVLLVGHRPFAGGASNDFPSPGTPDGGSLRKLSGTDGTEVWNVPIEREDGYRPGGVAVTKEGDVIVTGGLTPTGESGSQIVISKHSGVDGSLAWETLVGGGFAEHVAVDVAGDIHVSGSDGVFTGMVGAGLRDVFAVKVSGSDGEFKWAQLVGTTADEQGGGAAVAPNGDLLLVGRTAGDLVGPNLGQGDAFVSALASGDGAVFWTEQFGTGQGDLANAVALDPVGRRIIVGSTGGILGSEVEGLDADAFVVKSDE